jgi:hypothetical protein
MSQFRPWTITALTGLTSLDLSLLKMAPDLWRQFLRQVCTPTLLKLYVSGDAPVGQDKGVGLPTVFRSGVPRVRVRFPK